MKISGEPVKKWYTSFLDKSLNILFSSEKNFVYLRYLLILTVVGFILRLIGALHLDAFADDMVFASQSAGIMDSGIISTNSNPPLFFYLTDFAFKIFGYTTFASRFWPLIAGTLLIPLVFLVTRKFFNDKVALGASFFVAFSNFLVRMTFSEQSLVIFFFIFFATYFGLNYLESHKTKHLVWCAIGFGLGFITKYNAPFFIIAFLCFAFYHYRSAGQQVFSKPNRNKLILFLLVIFVICLPFLSFNYILYKEKGVVDVYFSRLIHLEKTQELYGGLAGQENSFFDNLLNPSVYNQLQLPFKTDLLMLIFGLFGLWSLYKNKNNRFLVFFCLFLFIPFVLQSAGAPLSKHFAFMPFLIAIPAGYALSNLFDNEKFNSKKARSIILIILIVILLINLGSRFGTPTSYLSTSATSSLKSYINENIPENALVVIDDRLYTSKMFWMASPRPLLTIQQFPEFMEYNTKSKSQVPMEVWFVECTNDDCGWGWVADKPEFNNTMEYIFDQIKNFSEKQDDIIEKAHYGYEFKPGISTRTMYTLHKKTIPIDPSLVEQTYGLQQFYFAPYMYRNMNSYILNYHKIGLAGILDKLSHWIILLSMVMTVVVMIRIWPEL